MGSRQLHVGMVSNELIHGNASRTGGFGYATRVFIRTVEEQGKGSVRFLTAEQSLGEGLRSGDDPMASASSFYRRRNLLDLARYRTAKLDLLTLLDYRAHYAYFLRHRPKLPVVIWVRDPRNKQDNERFASLREPGFPDDLPAQSLPPQTSTLRGYLHPRDGVVRPHVFAVSTPYLAQKIPDAYGVEPSFVPHLNTVVPAYAEPRPETEADRPLVVCLARLDPQKRPWIAVELARRMPDVDFVLAGRTHATLRWQPTDLPSNLELVGEVKGEQKNEILSRAWMLLNTAIHEALPVSWLETLGTATPLVANIDPEGVVSRFGRTVPFVGGVGYEALPGLEAAVRELVDDHELRHQKGAAGLEWVRSTHNAENFAAAWDRIVKHLGLDA